MPVFKRIFQLAVMISLTMFCRAVQADETREATPQSGTLKVARSDDNAVRTGEPDAPVDPTSSSPDQKKQSKDLAPETTIPKVVMSEAHQATCRKLVGDDIGRIDVTDIEGSTHELKALLSDRLTVLVFWNEKSVFAREQFQRIPVDILGSFAKHRVKVIAANVGGDDQTTRKLTGDAVDKIVSLVDKESKLFGHFATSCFPRTYLLDKSGKILWFDIEYSQSTRRELANALTYFLNNS